MSLGPIAYNTNKYEAICNDCSCGVREMKVDYKVSDQALKSKQVHLVKEKGVRVRVKRVGMGFWWVVCMYNLFKGAVSPAATQTMSRYLATL